MGLKVLFRGSFERKMVKMVVELVNNKGLYGKGCRMRERLDRKISL